MRSGARIGARPLEPAIEAENRNWSIEAENRNWSIEAGNRCQTSDRPTRPAPLYCSLCCPPRSIFRMKSPIFLPRIAPLLPGPDYGLNRYHCRGGRRQESIPSFDTQLQYLGFDTWLRWACFDALVSMLRLRYPAPMAGSDGPVPILGGFVAFFIII